MAEAEPPSEDEPIFRPAARVLLLDPDQRVLLFNFRNTSSGWSWWATPGGGLEPGETPEQGALRELGEETGLLGVELGPCVWHREHVFPWAGRRYRQAERFYLVRSDPFELAPTLPDGGELLQLVQHRWWSVEELEHATHQVFAPRRLAILLKNLLTQPLPAEPIDAGL